MKNALKEAFNVIIEKRVEGEAFAKFKQAPEFAETEKWIDDVFENLKASFSIKDQVNMLLELEEAWNSRKAHYLESAYRQGLENSVAGCAKKYELLVNKT